MNKFIDKNAKIQKGSGFGLDGKIKGELPKKFTQGANSTTNLAEKNKPQNIVPVLKEGSKNDRVNARKSMISQGR